ncbi:hypothetical protein DPMN_179112 [Dreissena polymorpha]|uniref:Uncharacterized protein n=1 Tax=Dreissena polymorpha TaxID=45954 RepID=A0A9D4ILU6_DREPO|nr:hypothetical protein DPMN_179112 [Dreissena polymorpha]
MYHNRYNHYQQNRQHSHQHPHHCVDVPIAFFFTLSSSSFGTRSTRLQTNSADLGSKVVWLPVGSDLDLCCFITIFRRFSN